MCFGMLASIVYRQTWLCWKSQLLVSYLYLPYLLSIMFCQVYWPVHHFTISYWAADEACVMRMLPKAHCMYADTVVEANLLHGTHVLHVVVYLACGFVAATWIITSSLSELRCRTQI